MALGTGGFTGGFSTTGVSVPAAFSTGFSVVETFGFVVFGAGVAAGTVRVTLSRRFATLSGRRLRRALAQVVLTVDATPGIERVRVRTELGALPGFDRPLATADFASYIAG